jgi:N utilization substance protein B
MSALGRSQARRCALQAMYEMDQGAGADSLAGVFADETDAPADTGSLEQGRALAAMAWEFRDESDRALADLVTDWPVHRQPVVDRNVLRLAVYEMSRGGVPHALAIDQAVELAREFGGERSPAFVNAVLDRWWKRHSGTA